MLQLDRLLFTQLDHTLFIHESSSIMKTCYQRTVPELAIQNPIMTIHSSLRGVSSLNLGRFFQLNQESNMAAMTTVYSAGSVGYVSRLHSATLSVLGTMISSPIDLENGLLSLETSAQVYNLYNTYLRVTAPTDVPWDRQTLRVQGELQDGTKSEIEDSVKDYIDRDIIGRARLRRENAESAFQRADEQVTALEVEYSTRDETLDQANNSYMVALGMFQTATSIVATAEGAFEEESEDLEAARIALDYVCNENDCRDILIDQTHCTTCYENEYANTVNLCTVIERQSELVSVRVYPDRVYHSWRYRRCCFWVCRYTCWFWSRRRCTTVCRDVCKLVTVRDPVYRRISVEVVRRRTILCPGRTVTAQRAVQCCSVVMVPVENTDCKEECRNSRQVAVQGLQISRAELAAPFQELESARSFLATSRATLAMETLHRDNALEMRDQLVTPISTARAARDICDENQRRILQELEKELRLAEQLDQQEDSIFRIVSASFNIFIDSTSPTQVPMRIQYESPVLEKTGVVVATFDFVSPREINLRRISEVIVNDMLNTTSPRARRSASRQRRQVDDDEELDIVEKSTNQIEFEENCADHSGVKSAVDELMQSLNAVRDNNEDAKIRLNALIADLMVKMEERNEANLNLDTLRDFFNVSIDDFASDLPEEESSYYKEYLQQLIRIASDSIRDIDSSSFTLWQSSTELLYSEIDSILSYPCNGFADCLRVVVDITERLVADLPASSKKMQLSEEFKLSSSKLLTLATAMNLSLPNAVDAVMEFNLLLQADVVSNYWCSSLPNITEQPPPRANVSLGGDLILNCSASSSLPVSVHWRRNGVPIPNANGYTFTLTNAQMSDSGLYTCVVTNAVGSGESLLTNVTVFELPEFFFVLSPVTTMVGNDSGAWFACNASGFPYPGWRWYFQSHISQPWSEIAGEDTNELTIPSPQFRDEGWYTCEAFNDHGYKRAEAVYLTVLPRTVSQLSLGVRFGLFVDNNGDASEGCNTDDVEMIVSEYLIGQTELGRASIDSLSVSYDRNGTEFAVSFALVSENVTDRRIRTVSFEQIQNKALPSRGDVVRMREYLQSVSLRGELSFTCNHRQLVFIKNSLNFDVATYHCPEGQELSRDFLFCGKVQIAFYNNDFLSLSILQLAVLLATIPL